MSTTIEGKAILVTGANRGIGQALVTEALRRGAARVYAGTRRPYAHPDPRVTVLPLDITDEGQVRAAAARAGSLDILVNNVSIAALAPIPVTPAYSLSKAAAFSLTQSLRMLLAAQGVRVYAVLTGPTDTDMVRDLDIPKAPAQSVAQGIFDGIDRGEEDIFPDPLSVTLADGWQAGPAKALERQNAALLRPQPSAA